MVGKAIDERPRGPSVGHRNQIPHQRTTPAIESVLRGFRAALPPRTPAVPAAWLSPDSDPSLASALGAISDSSAHFIAAATGATDRNLPSRHFPCRVYGDPYLFVDRDVRGFARGTRS